MSPYFSEVENITRNIGKRFEDNWKASIPENIFYYRPPDSAQSFGPNMNIRFSSKSPCDCFLFDGGSFYTLELKSVGTKSISFERNKSDNGIIHIHQIDNLVRFSKYRNIVSGFILDFRLSDKTYFLSIGDFVQMENFLNKKSFNEEDINEWCDPIEIDKKKLKVNYRYDVDKLLQDINECRKKKWCNFV